MAATSEIGELAELLQWKTEEETSIYAKSQHGRERISEEIADVAIYLIRLCQKLDLDFIEIVQSKIEKNEIKYPVDKSTGHAKKYTEL